MTITYYADEHTSGIVIKALRAQGIGIVRFIDVFPLGTGDRVHLEYATENDLVIVTADKGFFGYQNDRFEVNAPSAGVVFITPPHRKNYSLHITELKRLHEEETTSSMRNQRHYI